MWEILGEILGIIALAVIVGLCWIAKGFWDRLLKWIMQSAFGEWYKGRPWIWRVTVSIASVISLMFLFWCLWGYGFLIFAAPISAIEISVLASLVIFGFLILGACWNISEGLGQGGLDKRIIHIGFPSIALGILILLVIAIITHGILMLSLITIITGIAIGTIFFITMFFFMHSRARAKAWELEDQLKELDEQMSLHHITQEEYEQKKKKLLEKSET